MTNKKKDDAALIDALSDEVAKADAQKIVKRPETPEETESIDRLDAHARNLLQDIRRRSFEEIRQTRTEPARRALPARILAMARDAILERLRELETQAPVELQAAYRKLDQLGNDDLRVMLADLEETLGIEGEP